MADQWDFEDDDDLDEGSDGGSRPASGPADLRKAYRKAVRDLKAANDQLEQQAQALRSRSIKDALAAKGLNPKLAALIPPTVESTDEAVTAWVGEFSELFAPVPGVAGESAAVEGQTGHPAGQQFYTPEEVAQATVAGSPAGVAPVTSGAADMAARISAATSQDELMKAILAGQQ